MKVYCYETFLECVIHIFLNVHFFPIFQVRGNIVFSKWPPWSPSSIGHFQSQEVMYIEMSYTMPLAPDSWNGACARRYMGRIPSASWSLTHMKLPISLTQGHIGTPPVDPCPLTNFTIDFWKKNDRSGSSSKITCWMLYWGKHGKTEEHYLLFLFVLIYCLFPFGFGVPGTGGCPC